MREDVLNGVGSGVKLVDLLDGMEGLNIDGFGIFHLLRQ